MNKQRESVYALRRELLDGQIRIDDEDEVVDTREYLMDLAEDLLDATVDTYCRRRRGSRATGTSTRCGAS